MSLFTLEREIILLTGETSAYETHTYLFRRIIWEPSLCCPQKKQVSINASGKAMVPKREIK